MSLNKNSVIETTALCFAAVIQPVLYLESHSHLSLRDTDTDVLSEMIL